MGIDRTQNIREMGGEVDRVLHGLPAQAAGDLIVGLQLGQYGLKSVGANGKVLKANSAVEGGMEWGDESGVAARVVALVDAAVIAVDCDTTDIGTVTLADNRELGAPSGTPIDGQLLEIRVKQDVVGNRTLAYNAIYRFGSDILEPTLTTTGDKTDRLLFEYEAAGVKWDLIGLARGY